MKTPQPIGVMIRQHLYDMEMTQAQFAEKLGTNQQTVSNWMNGLYVPSWDVLKDLARVMRVPQTDIRAGVVAAHEMSKDERRTAWEECVTRNEGVPPVPRKRSNPPNGERVANLEARLDALEEQLEEVVRLLRKRNGPAV